MFSVCSFFYIIVCTHLQLKRVVGQSDAAKRFELQEQIEELRVELNHLDSQINGTEAQLVTEGEHLIKYIIFFYIPHPKMW